MSTFSQGCRQRLGGLLWGGCLAAAALAVTPAHAELPVETLTTATLPADATHRLYISDPVMGHLLDGRVHVLDGQTMRYLGMTGTGFSGHQILTPDGQWLINVATYSSRLQRGVRTDVAEVYRASDLTLQYEIELPPKHAQALMIKALLGTTPDGRFLLVQNATPATSVTVVDLQQRKVTAEFQNPGCWGVMPWTDGSARFSTVCGDGTLKSFSVDAAGQVVQVHVSAKFFDPDTDPVYTHFDTVGDRVVMISYNGTVHGLQLSGSEPRFDKPWSMVTDAADQRRKWKPCGYQLFAVDPARKQLIVGMHPNAIEGSHKSPAQQLWVFDLAKQQRVARVPGHNASAMVMSPKAPARLFLLDGMTNQIVSFDMTRPDGLKKPLKVSEPVGETPVFLRVTP